MSSLLDRAREGDVLSLALLMTRKLKPRGIEVSAHCDHGLLQLRFDATRLIPQDDLLAIVRRWLAELQPTDVRRVRLFAWLPNRLFPSWMVEFDYVPVPRPVGEVRDRGPMGDLDLAGIPERDRLAYYGALYAIANVDGVIDSRELSLIEQIVNFHGLSAAAQSQLTSYRYQPPVLSDCLAVLAEADESLRFGLMTHLLDTSWANDELDPLEEAAIALAQRALEIDDREMESIKTFVQEMRALGHQSFDQVEL